MSNVRKTFDAELDRLKETLLEMVKLSQNAIDDALRALKETDLEKAQAIIDNDIQINNYEESINNQVVKILAQQQPVASDLRRTIAVLKISNDVERIGDLAVNIAKSVLIIGNEELIKPIEDIPKMAKIAQGMLSDAIKAFYEEDVILAGDLAKVDDQVDDMYGKLIKELLELMTKYPNSLSQITQLCFICRYIERVGDHATNISENIIYMVKGKMFDLNA
ncbi:phosphate signaling complex protein PhoU [Aquibacillus albus]|uniref:Phosphate-specific transport system accessory protein PhoU n=1 Tax=Aquibacillus albus TaxID=1168171 RepID=A0ABS2MUW7_9BACI|nr:phosphate signaling complex protein PhoU [Aquibacillus albus]MBM7569660.1 phosphate transport system protein [Aquibacillus albus]